MALTLLLIALVYVTGFLLLVRNMKLAPLVEQAPEDECFLWRNEASQRPNVAEVWSVQPTKRDAQQFSLN